MGGDEGGGGDLQQEMVKSWRMRFDLEVGCILILNQGDSMALE